MADYNDGLWHGWNGGECPVDSEAMVLIQTLEGVDGSANDDPLFAGNCEWNWRLDGNDIIAFRVTRPAPAKPREWWISIDRSGSKHVFDVQVGGENHEIIHVREVLP